MVDKKKLVISGLFLSGLASAAQLNISIQPYFTYLSYSGSDVKKNGWATTLFGSLSVDKTHVFEAAWGYTHLNYKNNLPNWNQNDYTIAYTNYMLFPWYGKVGFHYIATDNTDISDSAKIYFADFGYIKKYRWNGGLFISYSDYRNGIAATEGQAHGGFYHWFDYYTGLYFHGDARWIHVADADKVGFSKKNYLSAGAGVTYFTSRYSVDLSGWIGERLFDVDNGGFVVYNLTEKYRGGLKLHGTYYFSKKIWVGAQLGYDWYKERTLTGTNNVGVFAITANIGYSF